MKLPEYIDEYSLITGLIIGFLIGCILSKIVLTF